MSPALFRRTLVASSVALAVNSPAIEAALVTNLFGTNAWSTDSANFTMLAPNGGVVGGTNDVRMVWDGSAFNANSDYIGPGSSANVTLSSTVPFFGHSWTAHDVQMFLPGTYSFDVELYGCCNTWGSKILTATVNPGQLGMHMLWDWGGGVNIDVVMVFDVNRVFGAGLLYSTVTNTKSQFKCDSGFTGTITKNCHL